MALLCLPPCATAAIWECSNSARTEREKAPVLSPLATRSEGTTGLPAGMPGEKEKGRSQLL